MMTAAYHGASRMPSGHCKSSQSQSCGHGRKGRYQKQKCQTCTTCGRMLLAPVAPGVVLRCVIAIDCHADARRDHGCYGVGGEMSVEECSAVQKITSGFRCMRQSGQVRSVCPMVDGACARRLNECEAVSADAIGGEGTLPVRAQVNVYTQIMASIAVLLS